MSHIFLKKQNGYNMIYFVTAKTSYIYPHIKAKRNSKKINLIYYFPEGHCTEAELVRWTADVVNDHVIHKDVLIYSNSSILFNAFRALIKEKKLDASVFHAKYYYLESDEKDDLHLRKHDVCIDFNGKLDYWPKGMFDTYGSLLDRII